MARTCHWLGMRLAGVALAATLALPAHGATAWAMDPAHSQLAFTATATGGEFDGQFRRFRADISFDPADLAGSRFRVEIETGSADTQDADRDAALAGKDFFASDRWPRATYEARRFVAMKDGRYQALGRLTIRGIGHDVPVVFTFRSADSAQAAVLSGGATIRRLDYGVGQGEWQDTKVVGDDVRIHFELALKPGTA
jgi:polyisoprenoid-binding protein YceI